MLLLPIRTETSARHAPFANVALIVANMIVFLVFDFSPTRSGMEFKEKYFVLSTGWPHVYQFFTYQFAHADIWHLVGNMLFLWVFGNGVNAKLGDIPYLIFYLLGGAFAGLMFVLFNDASLIGASGAIAAVTTAYLVLFPRSHVMVLYFFFFIFGYRPVPAMLIIGLKIILWDNIVAPSFGGASQIAHSAHLAGYAFGFVGALLLLLLKAVPRDHFDLLALIKRWHQRRSFAMAMADPQARAQAQFGRVARVEPASRADKLALDAQVDERTELRTRIAAGLHDGNIDQALRDYEQLIAHSPDQCLPAAQQLEIGRAYYAAGRFPQAAATFERYLATYRTGSEADEVRLLLGIICARDLQQYETAEKHLTAARDRLSNPTRRQQAEDWLAEVRAARG